MDLPPRPPEPASRRHQHSCRAVLKLAVLALGVLLFTTVLWYTRTTSSDEKVIWLTPNHLSAGPLTRLKHELMNLTAPLWRSYWNRQPQILIDSRLLTLSSAAMERSGLGVAVATNTDGTHAWIVSSAELSALDQRLKAILEVRVIAEPRLMTASGTAGGFFVGGAASTAAGPAPVNVTMDLIPEVISDSIRLTVGVTATEAMASPSSSVQTLKTNLSTAFRVLLSDRAGLVLAGNYAKNGGRTNWVLIISPTVWRVRGASIKSR